MSGKFELDLSSVSFWEMEQALTGVHCCCGVAFTITITLSPARLFSRTGSFFLSFFLLWQGTQYWEDGGTGNVFSFPA